MPIITGMAVGFVVNRQYYAGTDDRVYVVVHGNGGREFALDTFRDDFKAGRLEWFYLGDVDADNAQSPPDDVFPGGAVFTHVEEARPGMPLDPARLKMDLDEVTTVGIRKGGTRKGDDDDMLVIDAAYVYLYAGLGGSRPYRVWVHNAPREHDETILSNEHGLALWLTGG
jgi:hypothetical protein